MLSVSRATVSNNKGACMNDNFDYSLANDVIEFIESFCHVVEGPLIGNLVVLQDWQKDIIRDLYKMDNDGKRISRRLLLSMARRQGKTFLVSLLVIANLIGPCAPDANGTIISAALSRDQAAHVFRFCKKIIEADEVLEERIRVRDSAKELEVLSNKNFYKAISADARSNLGRSIDVVIHDEIGAWGGPVGSGADLYNALETSCSSAINPLSLCISTIGPNDTDLFNTLIDDAMSTKDPRTVLRWHTIPEDKDPFDAENWHFSMPALGTYCNLEEIRELAARAQRLPSSRASFLNLMANRRTGGGSGFVDSVTWNECGAVKFDESDLHGRVCYAGLDLSKTTDLTAFVLAFPMEDDQVFIVPRFFLPSVGIQDKSKIDRAPYEEWAERGLLRLTPGKTVGLDIVVDQIKADTEKFDIQLCHFDRWRMEFFNQVASERNLILEMAPFGQGYRDMGPAVSSLEDLLLTTKLAHNQNPIMKWNASATVVTSDPAGNRKFDKAKSNTRIDGMVALAMAVAALKKSDPVPSDMIFCV